VAKSHSQQDTADFT